MFGAKKGYFFMGAAAVLVAGGAALAQERAGIIVKVQKDAFQAAGAIGTQVGVRDEVFQNARVYTRQYGSMNIDLDDGSSLVVSPNSSLVIDEYVYTGQNSAGSLAVSLTRGALRMVSGKMEKSSYLIKTPVATIGVRGTTFALEVTDQETGVWVDEGAVVATAGGQTFELAAPAFASCSEAGCTIGAPPPPPASYPPNPSAPNNTDGSDGEFESEGFESFSEFE